MATSVKFKLISSRVKGKEGVICLQLIHNRKMKLIRTRFHLFPAEWDNQKEIICFDNVDLERQSHLQSIKSGMEAELKQLVELIRLLEQKSEYSVEELSSLYTNNSLNGYFFTFTDYTVKCLKEENRYKTATLALRKGIPVEVISESMGHENENTTRIYLASLGQSVVDMANAELIHLFDNSDYYKAVESNEKNYPAKI